MTERTAAWWLTSNDKDAAAWRNEASHIAMNKMIDKAMSERTSGKFFTAPSFAIGRPPTVAGKYFTLPGDNEPVSELEQPDDTPQPLIRYPHLTQPEEGMRLKEFKGQITDDLLVADGQGSAYFTTEVTEEGK